MKGFLSPGAKQHGGLADGHPVGAALDPSPANPPIRQPAGGRVKVPGPASSLGAISSGLTASASSAPAWATLARIAALAHLGEETGGPHLLTLPPESV